MNVRKEAGLKRKATNDYLELDIFIPSLNLAFEFQVRHFSFIVGADVFLLGRTSLCQFFTDI